MSIVEKLEKELREIKAALEKLKASAKSMDELVPLQERLGKIDSAQKDGKWVRYTLPDRSTATNSPLSSMRREEFHQVRQSCTNCWMTATVSGVVRCWRIWTDVHGLKT